MRKYLVVQIEERSVSLLTAEGHTIDTTIVEFVDISIKSSDEPIKILVKYTESNAEHSKNLDALVDRLSRGKEIKLMSQPHQGSGYYTKLEISLI